MDLLPHIELNPPQPPIASVIWLHGLGASGHDFQPIVPELRLPEELAVRFIFPHAPQIPVTVNGGYVMPAWYDILELSLERKLDHDQLMQSVQEVHKFIDHEISRGIKAERIIIAGFSQGGAVAYEAALTYPKRLAGLMALSTYFATSKTIAPHEANRQLPIDIQHGSEDQMVPEVLGKQAYTDLKARNYDVSYTQFLMEHEVCQSQIKHISNWVQKILR